MGDVLLMLMVLCCVCGVVLCVFLFLFFAPAGAYSKRGPNIKEYWEIYPLPCHPGGKMANRRAPGAHGESGRFYPGF